jgi:hypothetical protein
MSGGEEKLKEQLLSGRRQTFWKVLSVILAAFLAVSFFIGISMYWWPNIPSSPCPTEGRVYPLNNHGHYTYMNRQEQLLNLSLFWAFPALFFPLAAIQHFLDPFNQKRRWRPVRPPDPWLQ